MAVGRKKEEHVKQISLDNIVPPSDAVRTSMSREKLDSLKDSIKQIGLIQPIVVKKADNGKFEIVAGERRYMAHKELKMAVVRAIITTQEGLTAEIAKMHENREREDVNPLDEARFISRMHKKFSISQAEVAKAIGKSEAYVSQRLAIINAPAIIQEALEDGVISFSVAREFAQIDDQVELRHLIQLAAMNGITPNIAKSWRMQYEARKEQGIMASAGGEAYTMEPSETPDNKFECEGCHNDETVNRMKILKVCPACYNTLKTVD